MSKTKSPGTTVAAAPPVALIAGPTASGKTDCAIQLALALQRRGKKAAIVNADSAQIYSDLAVLSARPEQAEMKGVEHRLFGAWDGAIACSAADWAMAAKREIADLHANGIVPIIAGGTGMYIRVLLEGIAPVPAIDPEIRELVRALPTAEAYAALKTEDPDRAQVLAPADRTRIARALEVVRSTGRSLSKWQEERVGGIGASISLYPALLLPPRETLYERCNMRFAAMIDHGAVDEVERLLGRGLAPELPVMRAIGVREIAGWIAGEYDRDQAIALGSQATRNYAKRQYTWFHRQSPNSWARIHRYNYDIENLFEILLHH